MHFKDFYQSPDFKAFVNSISPNDFVLRAEDESYSDGYVVFLSSFILSLKPHFFSIFNKCEIQTKFGHMFVLDIHKEILDPNKETIAECWINNKLMYFWNDLYWSVAVLSTNNSIACYKLNNNMEDNQLSLEQLEAYACKDNQIDKRVVLYEISKPEIDQDVIF